MSLILGNFLKMGFALTGRLLILLPMAFCIFLILDSQDRMIRLFSVIALAVLEQVREWMLVSSVKALAKGNKAWGE